MKMNSKFGIALAMVFLIALGAAFAATAKDSTNSAAAASASEGTADPFWSEKEANEYLEEYSQFGMTYDKSSGKLLFEKKEIVFFIDTAGDGSLIKTFSISNTDSTDTVKIRTERNENGVITNLRELSKEDTIEINSNNTLNKSTSNATPSDVSEAGVTEAAVDSDCDEDLDIKLKRAYANYQITVVKDGIVYYKEELVGFFWDEGNYCYYGSSDGPLLLVKRNAAGEITAIKEITSQQAEAISGLKLLPDSSD